MRATQAMLAPLLAVAVAMVVGDLLILTYGESPATVYHLLLEGTWGNWYGFGQVLYKTMTLTCTGLAFAYAGRAGLFNVGAEGQLAQRAEAPLQAVCLPRSVPAAGRPPPCTHSSAPGRRRPRAPSLRLPCDASRNLVAEEYFFEQRMTQTHAVKDEIPGRALRKTDLRLRGAGIRRGVQHRNGAELSHHAEHVGAVSQP